MLDYQDKRLQKYLARHAQFCKILREKLHFQCKISTCLASLAMQLHKHDLPTGASEPVSLVRSILALENPTIKIYYS